MGWVFVIVAGVMAWMGIGAGSVIGTMLALFVVVIALPPIWKDRAEKGQPTYRGGRIAAGVVATCIASTLIAPAHDAARATQATQAQVAAAAPAKAAPPEKSDEELAAAKEAAAAEAEEAERIASGEHCLSGWDGSFPRLKDAVKRNLRNPRSFEHDSTVRSPVDDKGTFGLIMTYRAENGFGGMNVEAIGVEVDAKDCSFREVDAARLAKRLRKGGAA